MSGLSAMVMLALAFGQTAVLPPPFPRPGTTQIFENDVVAVWNVSWLKQQYPLHNHRYDLIGISYQEGDRIITQGNAPGRLVNTKPWEFQTNRANVTHVEEGASDPLMRAIVIELNRPPPPGRSWRRPGGAASDAWCSIVGEQQGCGLDDPAQRSHADTPPQRRCGRTCV